MIPVVARTLAIIALLLWFFILALELRLRKIERQLAAPDEQEKDRQGPGLYRSSPAGSRLTSRKSA